MLQEAKGLSSSQAGTELMLFEFAGIAVTVSVGAAVFLALWRTKADNY